MRFSETDLRKYAYMTVCIGGACLAFYVFFSYLLTPLLPFLISWGLAFALRPLSAFLHRHTGVSRKLWHFLLISAALVGLFSLCYLALSRLVHEVRALSDYLQAHPHVLQEGIAWVQELLHAFFARFGLDVSGEGKGSVILSEDSILAWMESEGGELLARLTGAIGRVLLAFPRIFLFLIVSILSAFYFGMDLPGINAAVRAVLPPAWQERLCRWKDGILRHLWRIFRSYMLLMLLTFSELLVGFLILDLPYALLLSAVFAVLDILPVLGVGLFLIPWGLFALATGNAFLGAGLLILYAVVTVLRQIAEPRIVSGTIGLHPLLTLFAMYAGFSLFGFFGMVACPFLALGIQNLHKRRGTPDNEKRLP